MTNVDIQFTILYDALDRIKLNCGGYYRFELIEAATDIEKAVQVIRDELYLERDKNRTWDAL